MSKEFTKNSRNNFIVLEFEMPFKGTCDLVRAVRPKKYVDCANWDKSMKLGTETHHRLYVKNFKGDTPRKSRDCRHQHFYFWNFFSSKSNTLYINRKEILCSLNFCIQL